MSLGFWAVSYTHLDVYKRQILYGIEIFIRPEFRGKRMGRRLYDARKLLCENLNLKSIMAGARIPNYGLYENVMSTKEYIEKVKYKEIFDPTLTFQVNNGFHIRKILKGYMPGDVESREYAALIEWVNINYEPASLSIHETKTQVRPVSYTHLFGGLQSYKIFIN